MEQVVDPDTLEAVYDVLYGMIKRGEVIAIPDTDPQRYRLADDPGTR